MSFTILHDHLDDVAHHAVIEEMPMYGIERAAGLDPRLPEAPEKVQFRLYDDDWELYYSGELDDDSDCANQSAALRWGESAGGCAHIKVKRGNEWVLEIG